MKKRFESGFLMSHEGSFPMGVKLSKSKKVYPKCVVAQGLGLLRVLKIFFLEEDFLFKSVWVWCAIQIFKSKWKTSIPWIIIVKGDAYADMLVNALDNEIYKHVTLDDLPKWSELVKNGQKFSKYSNYGQNTPHTKEVIEAMDKDIMDHTMWDQWPEWGERMSNYFADDMVYDTNYYDGTNTFMGNGTGIRRYNLWFHYGTNFSCIL